METIDLFERLSVALAVGLLIGLERGWQERTHAEGARAAGLRTFALSGLLGGVCGAIAARFPDGSGGAILLGMAFFAYAAIIAVYRYRETEAEGTRGATTVVAGLLSFALGAYAVLGDIIVSIAAGVAATMLLALKGVLHDWLKRLTWVELRSGLVLAAMTFILLPVLPSAPLDRWGAIVPREIWLMTVMLAALSFAGYVAIRVTGEERGVLLTGIAGGLVASTAVTLTMARLAREHPEQSALLMSGAAIAGVVMMARVGVLVGVFNFELLGHVMLPLMAGALVLAGSGYILYRRHSESGTSTGALAVGNPFELGAVLKFGALLAVLMVASVVVTKAAGEAGAMVLAVVSGLADVDAVTLSMARLGGETLSFAAAGRAILIAVAVNTLTKVVLAWTAGGAQAGRQLALGSVLALAAGAAALVLLPRV